MSARGRSENSRTSPSESPISRPLNQTVSFNKFKQPRSVLDWSLNFPLILYLLFRHLRERHQLFHEGKSAHGFPSRDLDLALKTVAVVTVLASESGPEDTSPTFPCVASNNSNRSRSILPCRTPSSSSPNGQSTPVNTPLSTVNARGSDRGSCCDHERQFDALQRKLAALTEKIDNLQGSSNTVLPQRRNENLPRDMVVSIKDFVADFMRTRVITMGGHFGYF